ncbi:MAG: NUDIX hydrolase [Solobacterium sp.]|nr:NUDIX hydrolase [Solobacterium sp.]
MQEVNEAGQTLEEFLAAYDDSRYRHPSNTVDMILMTVSEGKLKILLVKRKNHPFIHDWALPGGFINFDEDLETAVLRELAEETNITSNTYFRQLYTLGSCDRDPRTRVITTVYLSLTPAENIRSTKAADDAEDASWFTISKVSLEVGDSSAKSVLTLANEEMGINMAYEIIDEAMENYVQTDSRLLESSNAKLAADHIKAVNMAMDQVKHRAASTGILFNLLPSEFTLREIQTVYEAVIAKKVDTGNFRRDIVKMLRKTGNTKKVFGKQAALYRFNPLYEYLKENL